MRQTLSYPTGDVFETPRNVRDQLHVELSQVFPDEPSRAGPPYAGVHLDGSMGQVLRERRHPRQPDPLHLPGAEAKDLVVNTILFTSHPCVR